MATKILSPNPHLLCSLLRTTTTQQQHHPSWPSREPIRTARPKKHLAVAVPVSMQEPLLSSTSALVEHFSNAHQNNESFYLLAESAGYSLASYYTSLGLFVISVPGLWSLIKRSVKSKIVQKTFIGEVESKKAPNQVAGEILSFFTRNNFVVTDRGETVTFEGTMIPSRGQAALLTFCTCISLASVGLVLTITFPDVGNNWFWITILSPLAGAYYWKRASRKEQIKVKLMVDEGGTLSEILVQGDDQQVEQMRKELQLSEKGMVYVKGIFER
ncbi:hypothetical protein LWI28_000644 [Acer negundo]|uniref:Protein COFACTOR ASSEMBLY OF COMPLEX C SUBUNIT B CCB1, chloroplastic n=1 Tax=Acer negundo TaxID=4023 RepID=A0AAD5NQE2_ACENE|nr:hypothetical protein LWI28_000644 [Acer negundo]KAK4846835.1 hypothetical protein QYF36_022440 [Acer negundo]